jgi:hypothetical protein
MEYRKKPIVIEAFKYGIEPRPDWFNDKVTSNKIITYVGTDIRDSSEYYCEIKTLEGIMRGNCGDYIIKGVQGEIYPCKPDIFEMTYELASTLPQQEISDDEIEQQALTFAKEESYGELSADLWKGYVYGAKRTRDHSKSLSDKWKEYQDWLNEPLEISDEEIKKEMEAQFEQPNHRYPFYVGATWYREQLKSKPTS